MSTFYIRQFGCRATQADGAAIERQLLDRGCSAVDSPDSADFVIVNTCTVTAAADTEAREAIRKIHAANPSARVIVTGCYAQRAPEDLAGLGGVSFVVGNSHKPEIPDLVTAFEPFVQISGANPQVAPPGATVAVGDMSEFQQVLVAPVLGGEGNHTRPTLKIQDGCNSRCAFCIIPSVRGKSRSLPAERVLSEIDRLSAAGFREIVLSGINLGTWGRDLLPRLEFIDLLRRVLGESSVEQLRVSSIEPLDVTRDLVELFAKSHRLARHFHLPLQSGSDRILARMHRWYRTEHYARRVELVRELLPDAAVGADVIAGFPGETEDDHALTLAFIERLPFTYLHVFSYSARPGTRAAGLPQQVPVQTIKRRARELRALGESKSAAFRRTQLGRKLRVLTLRREGPGSATRIGAEHTPALSSNFLRLDLEGSYPNNQWLDAMVKAEGKNVLIGELVEQRSAVSLAAASPD